MGLRAKSKQRDKRKKQKQAAKAQKAALYESYRASGSNRKSKRFRQNTKASKKVALRSHAFTCGNPGCLACYPLKYDRYVKNGKPVVGMPHYYYQKWIQNTPEGSAWSLRFAMAKPNYKYPSPQ